MKAKVIVSALAVSAAALAVQDVLKFERKFAVGDKAAYGIKLTMEGPGTIDVSLTQSTEVLKVNEDGTADVSQETSNVVVLFNGQEIPAPAVANQKLTLKVDRFGAPISAPAAAGPGGGGGMRGGMIGTQFVRFLAVGLKDGLKLGETHNVDYKDANDEKVTAKGTVKLESVTDGVGKVVIALSITTAQTTEPMKLNAVSFYKMSGAEMQSSSGTMSNLPPMGPVEINSIQFSMTLKK
jgi:hypothetical protein